MSPNHDVQRIFKGPPLKFTPMSRLAHQTTQKTLVRALGDPSTLKPNGAHATHPGLASKGKLLRLHIVLRLDHQNTKQAYNHQNTHQDKQGHHHHLLRREECIFSDGLVYLLAKMAKQFLCLSGRLWETLWLLLDSNTTTSS